MKCISIKEVVSQPMTRQKYNDYRGWELPADENGKDKGFLIIDESLKHESWVTAKVFKSSHLENTLEDFSIPETPHPDHQTRVINEFFELKGRSEKLEVFNNGDFFLTLPLAEQKRMNQQLLIMKAYQLILADRIKNF